MFHEVKSTLGLRHALLVALFAALLVTLTGCPDGEAEQFGEQVDDMAEDVGDKTEDVIDAAEDEIDSIDDPNN